MMRQPTPQRYITPVVWWVEMPEWLTAEQASFLTGYSVDYINWAVQDGCMDANDAGLICKDSLYEFQETLAEVLHWDE
jgi:hypothetical protein